MGSSSDVDQQSLHFAMTKQRYTIQGDVKVV
jgi:hypothetical protein